MAQVENDLTHLQLGDTDVHEDEDVPENFDEEDWLNMMNDLIEETDDAPEDVVTEDIVPEDVPTNHVEKQVQPRMEGEVQQIQAAQEHQHFVMHQEGDLNQQFGFGQEGDFMPHQENIPPAHPQFGYHYPGYNVVPQITNGFYQQQVHCFGQNPYQPPYFHQYGQDMMIRGNLNGQQNFNWNYPQWPQFNAGFSQFQNYAPVPGQFYPQSHSAPAQLGIYHGQAEPVQKVRQTVSRSNSPRIQPEPVVRRARGSSKNYPQHGEQQPTQTSPTTGSLNSTQANAILNKPLPERLYLNTRAISEDLEAWMAKDNVNITLIADYLFNKGQGTLSEQKNKTKEFAEMNSAGQKTFIRLYNWLNLEEETRREIWKLDLFTPEEKEARKQDEKKEKMPRFQFNEDQKKILDDVFEKNQNPSIQLRAQLADQLQVNVSQIKNFFANARTRRRNNQ